MQAHEKDRLEDCVRRKEPRNCCSALEPDIAGIRAAIAQETRCFASFSSIFSESGGHIDESL